MKARYVELDLLRTLAIIMMIVYHLAYDLESYYGLSLGVFGNAEWVLLRQSTASLFLLLVGCSFAISWNRTPRYTKYLKRGLGVIACGMLVSAATYWWEPATYVRFGILHMIGASILLLPFFTRARGWNGVIGLVILGAGTGTRTLQTSVLLPLGFTPANFVTVDYYPLIPWFGIVLIGYAAGHFFYVREKLPSLFSFHFSLFIPIAWPGRHALLIYLLHQPIILMALALVGRAGLL